MAEGVSGDIEGFSYMHTCMCAHMHTMYMHVVFHVKKLQMATTTEAAMFIMINMYGYVCAYVFVHAYMCACVCVTVVEYSVRRGAHKLKTSSILSCIY